ncbi:HesA/MoeB/ThiF family protein, partial [Cycloclasticus pugetii]
MDDQQLLRYSRQILLPQIDVAGQQRLLDSRVLIVGLGGLGAPVALYLAAAGVGTLVLADHDQVDLTNLQRQIIHHTADIGRAKVDSAADHLLALNPQIQIRRLQQALADSALQDAVTGVDLVLDCSDNFATRQAVNAACVAFNKPL